MSEPRASAAYFRCIQILRLWQDSGIHGARFPEARPASLKAFDCSNFNLLQSGDTDIAQADVRGMIRQAVDGLALGSSTALSSLSDSG